MDEAIDKAIVEKPELLSEFRSEIKSIERPAVHLVEGYNDSDSSKEHNNSQGKDYDSDGNVIERKRFESSSSDEDHDKEKNKYFYKTKGVNPNKEQLTELEV